MHHQTPAVSALMRLEQALQYTGEKRSSYFAKAAAGLMPRPVKIGARATAIPMRELEAVNAARIAGQTDEEVRTLVASMHAERTTPALSGARTA
jgi:prophage regulatory protein